MAARIIDGYLQVRMERSSTVQVRAKVLKTIEVLYNGWELDNEAWLLELPDGKRVLATTNHGGPPTVAGAAAMIAQQRILYAKVLQETDEALNMVEEQ